jgi:hypothetical protein
MDVYGKAATTEAGEYFRRNVWGWRPLWGYVEMMHPDIARQVEHGHTNDGDGLDDAGSLELAQRLRHDLVDGTVDTHVRKRDEWLASLPRVECSICSGTGQRPDGLYGVEWDKPGCNGCGGEGTRPSWETYYDLEARDIAEFAEFLEGCGGFSIC